MKPALFVKMIQQMIIDGHTNEEIHNQLRYSIDLIQTVRKQLESERRGKTKSK